MGSPRRWKGRALIRLNLSGHSIEIRQRPDAIGNWPDLRDGFHYTTDLYIHNARSFQTARTIAHDICYLLALATLSQVRPFAYEFPGHNSSHAVTGVTLLFRPTIDPANGRAIRVFLETTWQAYRRLKRSRRLPAVIDYLLTAEAPLQPLEVELLLLFVTLETLKATLRTCRAGIPFCKGAFRRLVNPSKPCAKQPAFSFEDLLTRMFLKVRMRRGIRRIVSLRNEIVHFGLSRKPISRLSELHDQSMDLIQEYLLRLLEYRGSFLIYSAARARRSRTLGTA